MYDREIRHAREIWELELLKYCSGLFKDHWLPSHDIQHHTRVWENVCMLASSFNLDKSINFEAFFEQLIIACYFHDLGLLYEKGPRHGRESRLICEQFLKLRADEIRFDITDLLLAIEHHDDKDYNLDRNNSHSAIYQLLTLADDLDAFGAIGCYRYIEIYLMRDLISTEIPVLILENAENRYRNFVSKMRGSGFPVQMIEEKYARLKKLLLTETFNKTPDSLVEWIDIFVVKPRDNPLELVRKTDTKSLRNDRIEVFCEYLNDEV